MTGSFIFAIITLPIMKGGILVKTIISVLGELTVATGLILLFCKVVSRVVY